MKRIHLLLLCSVLFGAGCAPTQTPIELPPSSQPLASVSTLDLSGRGLTAIPSDVFSKTALEELNLSNNRLTGAPQAEIRHLQKLKTLNLSNNQLTGLPAELGQLQLLEVLNVSNNQLTGLPQELGNLTGLRILDVSGNAYSTQDLDQIAAKLLHTEIKR